MNYSDRFHQNQTKLNLKANGEKALEVIWTHRWQIFHRLQALEITCHCATNEPLWVRLNDVRAAIQIWSVVKQHSAPRHELVTWLDRCWQIENYRNNS
ncbi:Asr1405/Asl0597 family protein [Myxosarcina sp. GI1]|uniref:Asr1405/Asl0597 family protein n=1 Tax=Myxosarcina sp. GI1 TaxID=1541065 RepID=UPI00068D9F18|nr:Asr1405/Asl0597 family protein [Myxosarcina sp. GI1]